MAAAADRLAGDVLEHVSPELVLVDAALYEELRQRLDVPDDTFARIGRIRIESHPPVHLAEVTREPEQSVAGQTPAQTELLPATASALGAAHHEVGIEDLIVFPPDERPSKPPKLDVPDESATPPSPVRIEPLVAAPEELVAEPTAGLDDLIVVPTHDAAQPESTRGSYPMLPSPPGDADDEDATDVVLRQIRNQFEPERPARRRRRHRLLSFVSLVAALSSITIWAVDRQLGISELPRWIPS